MAKIVKSHLVYPARPGPLLVKCDRLSYGETRQAVRNSQPTSMPRDFARRQRVASSMLRQQLLDSSRGRIVTLLRHGGLTVDDIASKLRLTPNAVRAQMTGMERDGIVRRIGQRPGTTRPSHVFELTPEVEQLLSEAYFPFLTQLVSVFANALPTEQVDRLMRNVGKGLANDLPVGRRPSGGLRSRVSAASELLNKQLGAITHVEGNGGYVIRGVLCPLAALTGKHPGVCLAMESLLTEVTGATVHECCDRSGRPKCCFEIHEQTGDGAAKRRR